MSKYLVIYAILLTALLTYLLYSYHDAQPADAERIAECNKLVSEMPETTQEEINRSIHTFHECLED